MQAFTNRRGNLVTEVEYLETNSVSPLVYEYNSPEVIEVIAKMIMTMVVAFIGFIIATS